MVYAQPSTCPRKGHTLLWDFNIQTDHLIPARRLDLIIIKKREFCKIIDVAVPVNYRINLK